MKDQSNHYFLVIVDRSEEMHKALRFAANRARNVGGQIVLLSIITPNEFQHWLSVGEKMREEAMQEAELLLARACETAEQISEGKVHCFTREGNPQDEIIKFVREEQKIHLLVLAADAKNSSGPGPLVSAFASKALLQLGIPITIVPGNLDDEAIDAIC